MKHAALVVLAAWLAVAVASGASAGDAPPPIYYVLDQRVWRVEADGSGAKELPLEYESARDLGVAPKSRRIAFVDWTVESAFVVIAKDDAVEARVPIPKGLDARVTSLRWSPAGDRLALAADGEFGVGTGSVHILDLAKGASFVPLGRKDAHDMEPSWSPDGKAVVVAAVVRRWDEKKASDVIEQHWESAIEIVDLETRVRRRIVPPSARLGLPAWSPDGRHVAYASITDVYVVPAAGGDARSVIRGNVAHGPHWSPDGKRLLVTFLRLNLEDVSSAGERLCEVITMNPDGSQRRAFHVSDVWSLAFGPDGSQLALVLEADRLVRVKADGGGETVLARRKAATADERMSILTEVAWSSPSSSSR